MTAEIAEAIETDVDSTDTQLQRVTFGELAIKSTLYSLIGGSMISVYDNLRDDFYPAHSTGSFALSVVLIAGGVLGHNACDYFETRQHEQY